MDNQTHYDVIIIGGSNAGLSAAMSLGRALQQVLIIDSGKPCNRQTPHSHNFLMHDGWTPADIAAASKREVLAYSNIQFLSGTATRITGSTPAFEVTTADGKQFTAKKLLFATGVKDIMPDIPGFAECWGISVIHCPYCHGYEYRNKPTGILLNNEMAADYAKFIQNWSSELILFTNGKSTLTPEQQQATLNRGISIIENEIAGIEHEHDYLTGIKFTNGSVQPLTALYGRPAFEQHCPIPQQLGCAFTEQGYILVDDFKKTTVPGVYAAGDNTTMMRSVANAVAAGGFAGAMISHEIINERP